MVDKQDAEDILQESFSDAFFRIKDFRFESTFGAWLKQIVVYKCISALRKRKIKLELIEDIEILDLPEDDDLKNVQYENRLKVEKVKNAMKMLPEGSRTIFSLYLFEGYDHMEISGILNISESTSKSQYMRARRRIIEIIMQQ
jgi:RNA polymerase sigma factor (sigma-70 family)